MRNVTVTIYSVEGDGPPPTDIDGDGVAPELVNRIAFIWDGEIISGWPEWADDGEFGRTWCPGEDRFGGPVTGVTHWVLFPDNFLRLTIDI